MRNAASALLLLAAVLCAACDPRSQPATDMPIAGVARPGLAAGQAGAAGIAWFTGDVEAAFAAAAQSRKPIFLYWGAEWCPTCKQLKSSVFSRSDFIERSKLFVPVYLDGDLPAAQKWGDVFRVAGYPTVVILGPDRTEITRIAGGMDLSLYASVLENTLGDVRPVREIVELAAARAEPLEADDCRRLAYHAFHLEDEQGFAPELLARAFESASRQCPAPLATERARLLIMTASQVGAMEAGAIGAGIQTSARYRALIDQVSESLGDTTAAAANADALGLLGAPFFTAARAGAPQAVASLRERWMRVAAAVASDASRAPADQLNAERLKLAAARGLAPDGSVPSHVAREALDRAGQMLAQPAAPLVHASIVNAAVNIYLDLGDLTRAQALLAGEAATSRHPYYYLGDLADVEEKLGRTGDAVEHLRQAYAAARGPASRFQWGFNYVSGLLRMRPDDTAAILDAGLAMLGELDGPDGIHGRTRIRLQRLDAQMREWATTRARRDVVTKLHEKLVAVCAIGNAAGSRLSACAGAFQPAAR
jgi:protein disulfide-isomerase